MLDRNCIFCKIAAGVIDADIVYQTGQVVAFRDTNPQAPTHVLVIPRKHIATINDLEEPDADDVGRLYLAAQQVARDEHIDQSGYRTVMNCMEGAGQSVFHIHLHVLGGRRMSWPPG
ncbi:MAG TPA: histidine triad nucleotide-binding protein [Woeseiaceae bacterium]|nr:histidine triad nucleotide-binding protein [Woeseiaceae bacterium]